MDFRSRDVDNSTERLICTGLIVSDHVIAQLAPFLMPKLMTARYTAAIVGWCLDYYKQFEKAPGRHIQDICESHKQEGMDPDVVELVEELLSGLNDEAVGTQFNEQYVLAEAEKYIRARSLQISCSNAMASMSRGQLAEAEGYVTNYAPPKITAATGADIFSDDFWKYSEKDSQPLFRFHGELDRLLGPVERDSFISLIAPEKRGKTWWLLHTALTAFRNHCNVAFFACGDMTETQMRRRIQHMLTGRDPKRAKKTIKVPVLDCLHNQKGKCPVGEEVDCIIKKGEREKTYGGLDDFPDHIVCTRCFEDKEDRANFIGIPWWKWVNLEDVEKPRDEAIRNITRRAGGARFRLFCCSPDTLTVAAMRAHLDTLQRNEDFLADVVVLDYADLLACEENALRMDYRQRINVSWMALRALAQDKRSAVITATQAKGDTRKKSQVDQWDTSEDKRKLAHVTGMWALNQTPQEKRQGVIRISNLAARDSDFDTDYHVAVLQCLALGKPYIVSYPYKGTLETSSVANGRKRENSRD